MNHPETIGSPAILRLQEGFARVGDDQQSVDNNRSMAAIGRYALWPEVAGQRPSSLNTSGLNVDSRSSTRSSHAPSSKVVGQIDEKHVNPRSASAELGAASPNTVGVWLGAELQ